MPKVLKWTANLVAALATVFALAFLGAAWWGERKRERTLDVPVVPVPYAKDAAALRHGKEIFESRGCGECHGKEGGGAIMIGEPGGFRVRTPNITRGPGTVVSAYSEADWVRAIRHCVSPRGHALLLMPCQDFNRLGDADFAALVAYTRSLDPVSGESAEIRMPALMKALYGAGLMRDAAERINHRLPPSP